MKGGERNKECQTQLISISRNLHGSSPKSREVGSATGTAALVGGVLLKFPCVSAGTGTATAEAAWVSDGSLKANKTTLVTSHSEDFRRVFSLRDSSGLSTVWGYTTLSTLPPAAANRACRGKAPTQPRGVGPAGRWRSCPAAASGTGPSPAPQLLRCRGL